MEVPCVKKFSRNKNISFYNVAIFDSSGVLTLVCWPGLDPRRSVFTFTFAETTVNV